MISQQLGSESKGIVWWAKHFLALIISIAIGALVYFILRSAGDPCASVIGAIFFVGMVVGCIYRIRRRKQ